MLLKCTLFSEFDNVGAKLIFPVVCLKLGLELKQLQNYCLVIRFRNKNDLHPGGSKSLEFNSQDGCGGSVAQCVQYRPVTLSI